MKNNRVITNLPKILELAYQYKVDEAMSANIIAVSTDDTINDVRKILKHNRISGVPVIDSHNIVGIISVEDCIDSIIHGKISEKVEDNMTPDVKCLYSDELLIQAISQFDELGYGRFPVIERDTSKIVGIITKGDIFKCLLKRLEVDYEEEELYRYRASHIFQDVESDRTSLTLRYTIKGGDYKVAGEQSGYLKSNLLRLGIPPKITRRVVIAACEAEMNIIIFTSGGEIIVRVEKNRIKVNAVDSGPGIADIEKAMLPGYSTAPDWVRELGFGAGMGLPNIKRCSDQMSVTSEIGKGTNVEYYVNVSE